MLRPSRLLLVPALLGAVLSGGCATASGGHSTFDDPPAQVEVRNDRWEDLTVYLDRDGSLFRLGVVSGKGSARLEVPDDYIRMNCWVRLVARSAGREAQAVSQLFGMGPGSQVSWAVPLTSGESPVSVLLPAY